MNSNAESSSTVSVVRELLAAEKEEARMWLRSEMNGLVNPLIESMFTRLEIKLTAKMEQILSGDGGDRRSVQLPQSTTPTSSHLIQQGVAMSIESPPIQPIPSASNSTHQSFFTASPVTIINSQINFPNEHTSVSPHQQSNPQDIVATVQPPQSTESLNDSVQLIDIDHSDDDDSVQWIENVQGDDELLEPLEMPRMDTTQSTNDEPEVARQSPRQQEENNEQIEVNIRDKRIITISLQCSEFECHETFAEDELNNHMMEEHLIGPFRCIVQSCARSFYNKRTLGDHIKRDHQDITQWNCDKCSKHFVSYERLFSHKHDYHQMGLFRCSYPSCTFTGEYRRNVYNHHECHRTSKTELVCREPGCAFKTKNSTTFKDHQRAHLGIMPFRCKWPQCEFANASRNTTMMHIKRVHFSSGDLALTGKPTDYLEVVQDQM